MTRKSQVVAMVFGFVALTCASALPAEEAHAEAEVVRDRAISKTTAWRPKSAQTILQKAVAYEESQPWLTAEALLMATFGIGQDEKTVTQGLSILAKQAKKDTTDPVSEFYRGEVLSWLDRTDEAKKAWKGAKGRAAALVADSPRNALGQFYLGASLVRLKDPANARKALKKANRAGFEKPMVDFQVGLSYLLENNWKAAIKSFDAVHELDPRYAHLYFYRGLAWDKMGRKDHLLNDLSQFVKLAPNSVEAGKARAVLSAMK